MSRQSNRNAYVSNKIPNPTCFSNQRSSNYLRSFDTCPTTRKEPQRTGKFYINLEELVKIEEILTQFQSKINEGEDATDAIES